MLFLYFGLAAIVVVLSAIQVTRYVTALNEKTKISAGFVGLILFSMITSLPELLTSSYAIILDQPTMSFGNILGSNAFNLVILTVINLIFIKKYMYKHVSKSNKLTILTIIGLNFVVLFGLFFPIELPIPYLNVSLPSAIIFVLYMLIIYRTYKSSDMSQEGDEKSGLDHLSIEQIMFRGLMFVVTMVLFSLIMTKISDQIVLTYPEIGATLVGSLMLAVATSLPEVVTTLSLVKMGKTNMAIGGIVGSSLFNFNILFITDLLSVRRSTFAAAVLAPDIGTLKALVVLGILLAVLMSLYFRFAPKLNKMAYIIASVLVISSYIVFLQFMFF